VLAGEGILQAGDDQPFDDGVGLGDRLGRALEADVGERGTRETLAHDQASLMSDRYCGLENVCVVHGWFLGGSKWVDE
jgi:hypothetical protein